MDKWPTIAVSSGVAVTIAVQELLHQGVHPHATHDIEILDPPQGKLAIEAATSGTAVQLTGNVIRSTGGRLIGSLS